MTGYLEEIFKGKYLHYSNINKHGRRDDYFITVTDFEDVKFTAHIKRYTYTSLLPDMKDEVIVTRKLNKGEYYVVKKNNGFNDLCSADDLIMPLNNDSFIRCCKKKKYFPILMPDMS